VAFSSDDAWVLGACEDKTVRAWDVATGNLLAAPIAHALPIDLIAADAASRLIRTAASNRNYLWRLPEGPSPQAGAVPATTILSNTVESTGIGLDFDAGTGLMTFGTNDGWVRLWRLRGSPMLPRPAPPVPAPSLRFDGQHVVVAEGSVVQVVNVRTGAAASNPLAHPQPVSQAILSADGSTLVAVSGREIHTWDWRGGVARHAPVRLPASPAWLDSDDSGQRVLVGWHAIRDRRPQVVLRVMRIVDGGTEAEAAVESGIAALRVHDGSIVIRRFREVEVLRFADLARLHPNRAWPDEDGAPLLLTDARVDGEGLWLTTKAVSQSLATRRVGAALQLPMLVHWPLAGAQPQVSEVTGYHTRIMPRGDGGVVVALQLHTNDLRHILREPTGRLQRLVQPSDGENFFAFALNAEKTLLARGLRDGVIVTDAATGEPLSLPLRAALDYGDVVTQIAFAPDSEAVLARTAAGRWW
jgi:hypothetical protein